MFSVADLAKTDPVQGPEPQRKIFYLRIKNYANFFKRFTSVSKMRGLEDFVFEKQCKSCSPPTQPP